jgi:endo-1,4-beta-xylanase
MRYVTAKVLGACALAASALSIDSAALAQNTGGISCHVDYAINPQFFGGFIATLTIHNTGTTPISGWTLTWSFSDGQTILYFFNGDVTQSGTNVSVQSRVYNASIPAGGSNVSQLGFQGTWNNITNSIPTSFALNGTACN